MGGGGFGVAFLGALRALSVAIPPEHRAAVMSAFYIVAYASISVPAILAGVGGDALGLQSTFEIFGSSSPCWRWWSPSRPGARARAARSRSRKGLRARPDGALVIERGEEKVRVEGGGRGLR